MVAGVHRERELVLACAAFDNTVRRQPEGERGPEPWSTWLGQRARRVPLQANDDGLGSLQVPTRFDGAGSTGQVLGDRFEILGVLGTGGMSTVYRAKDRLHDSTVALKLLSEDLTTDQELRQRFKREAQRMRALNHPNVLSDVELGELDTGRLFLRMPVLEGGSLAEVIATGAVQPEQREAWSRQLLAALVALEKAGVLHRDIKPSNLMLYANGKLLLVDFGIALDEADVRLTRTLQQLGSLAYLAPEARSGHADHRSDLYSAALVLHELCTGEAPRGVVGKGIDGVLGEVVRAIGQNDPELRPDAHDALVRLDGGEPLPGAVPQSPMTQPMASVPDDVAVLQIGALSGALGIALWLGSGALGVFHADWVSGPVLLGIALCLSLPGPLLAGARLRSAPARAALAGGFANALAFPAGSLYPMAASTESVMQAALLTGDTALAEVLSDAAPRLLLWAFGGMFVALSLGAATAGGLALATRVPARPPPPPNHTLRLAAGSNMVALVLVLHPVTIGALDLLMQSVARVSSTVGTELVAGGLILIPALLDGAFVAVGGWLMLGSGRPHDRENFQSDAMFLLFAVAVFALAWVAGSAFSGVSALFGMPFILRRLAKGWSHRKVPSVVPAS